MDKMVMEKYAHMFGNDALTWLIENISTKKKTFNKN